MLRLHGALDQSTKGNRLKEASPSTYSEGIDMRCKPGQMAVVIAGNEPTIIGRVIVTVRAHPFYDYAWVTDPPLFRPYGLCPLGIRDSTLMPIGDVGDDAVDETLSWLPVPSTHRETETS